MAHFHHSTLQRPSRFNFTRDVVDYWATQQPQLAAMEWISQDQTDHRRLTYAYFSERSHRAAILLESLGLRKGDRLILIMPRIPEWWEIACAAIRAGIVICPCTTLAMEKDIEYRVQVSKAKAFVGDEVSMAKFLNIRENCPTVQAMLQTGDGVLPGTSSYNTGMRQIPEGTTFHAPQFAIDDDCLIYFTSGTTGMPKMVLHSQISYPLAHAITGKRWLALEPGQMYWNLSEQGWAKAAWSFFGAWNCGATLFIHDDRTAFKPAALQDILHRYPIATLCAPPTVFRQLVSPEYLDRLKQFPPSALRSCVAAGEPLNAEVVNIWRKATNGIDIRDGYGQTETIMVCGNFPGVPIKPGSMGKPAPNVPLTVLNDGREAADGEEGDIALLCDASDRFFGVFQGYLSPEGQVKRPQHTTSSGKSWFLTGDRAYRDKDGYFWFVGRSDDIINSSGYRIGPFEVESTLKEHPAVVESAVVASPDPIRVEVVKAFIVLTPSYAARPDKEALKAEIQDFCKRKAAPYKYPRKVEFVDAAVLPKTTSGKIKRAVLRSEEFKAHREKL
ncbi:hypothetical protein FE257_009121 [Aspergillus nanangensis]|uniref:medium-chain acyl-CoA ligase n=1 Tax=Aspergillus nanangensis TaxID=2582783 RepID=A0AAD4GZY7_ASPNN|nr:hypothetical protein FE257_009121 [Aspergillus nanangensis]